MEITAPRAGRWVLGNNILEVVEKIQPSRNRGA